MYSPTVILLAAFCHILGNEGWFVLGLVVREKRTVENETVVEQSLHSNLTNQTGHPEKAERFLFQIYDVKREHVTFFLYNKDSTQLKILPSDIKNFPTEYKNYMFIVHGWTGSREVDWYSGMTKAILGEGENAVIQVDWSTPARYPYMSAPDYSDKVGRFLADFIIKLHEERNIDLQKVTLVGHSLGAHVCGFAGKKVYRKLHTKIGKIIGSDPAGPLFNGASENKRLSKDDASCVVILHTDIGRLGYTKSFGALDFFPNHGVAPQPGCKESIFDISSIADIWNSLVDKVSCSHARAPLYLIETFNYVWGTKSFEMLSDTKRKFLQAVSGDCSMGKGDYFFRTNNKPPYL